LLHNAKIPHGHPAPAIFNDLHISGANVRSEPGTTVAQLRVCGQRRFRMPKNVGAASWCQRMPKVHIDSVGSGLWRSPEQSNGSWARYNPGRSPL
jgi:hypothetical protein